MPLALLLWFLASPQAQFSDVSKRAAQARDDNRIEDATRLFRQSIELNPVWAEGWWNLGTLLYDQGAFAGARDAFSHFVKLETKASPGWAFLGLCEFETKDYPNALQHMEHALRLGLDEGSPLAKVTRYHAGLIQVHLGQFETALQLFGQLAVLGADDRETIVAAGIAGLRLRLFPADLPPSRQAFAYEVGHAIYEGKARREGAARSEFEALIVKYPGVSELHNLFGQLLISGEPDRALAEWKAELEITPNHVPALLQIAFEYLKRGEAETGIPFARQAVSLEPSSFVAHNAMGRLLVQTGGLERGIAELETAKKLAPNSPETRSALASAYAKAGRSKDAARERAEFLRLTEERDHPR